MKRSSRKSTLDVFMTIASHIPWPVSLIAAPVIYFVLHYLAQSWTPVKVIQLTDMSKLYVNSVVHMVVSIGQYAIPLILVITALVNALRQRVATSRFKQIAELKDVNALLDMTWQQFEAMVAEHFRQQGYKASPNSQAGSDGGVDIELRKGSELSLVQCKQWRSTKVGAVIVRELYGVMSARGAVHGYVVCAGSFTADASEFVIGRNVTLLNGQQLVKAMNEVLRKAAFGKTGRNTAVTRDDQESAAPRCPVCGKRMVKRASSRGWENGNAFWGCSGFPKCRGTRSV